MALAPIIFIAQHTLDGVCGQYHVTRHSKHSHDLLRGTKLDRVDQGFELNFKLRFSITPGFEIAPRTALSTGERVILYTTAASVSIFTPRSRLT